MSEVWKPIKGFEEEYKISNEGQVFSIRRNKLLKPKIDRYGYKVVALSKEGKLHHRTIHRLVAQAFIPNPSHLPTVNHINEVKTDNRVSNLEWLSVADNDNHGSRNARMADSKSKLPVVQIFPGGNTVVYKGVKDAWRITGINRNCIAQCCKNIRKTAGGYEWRYANEMY
ncbi:MAG: HNH endonuclease [Bacteroidales bacterium]|nr:HNH endonuclease [Bacteroidales bacterium]